MAPLLDSQDSFCILAPNGILGYGYEHKLFWHGINEFKPAAICVDAGSTDPGPSMIGSGDTLCSREAMVRDLTPLLEACYYRKIKFLATSAGGAGLDAQTDELVEIIESIAEEKGWNFKIASIHSSVSKDIIRKKFKENKIVPCGEGPPPLEGKDIDNAVRIVAQIGREPIMEVLKDDSVDIIIAGRAYDPSPFAAFATHHGADEAISWHMGKICECGALCALPKGISIVARVFKDNFVLTPLNPIERCSPLSVAAHTLYEKTRPDLLHGPGGVLDLTKAKYEQLEDLRSVRVSGSLFHPSPRYQVKLEGVELVGYRSMFIGGIRDPILIAGIDEYLEKVKERAVEIGLTELETDPDHHKVIFHVYGKNAVMGALEPVKTVGHEIGVLGEIVAPTQAKANSMASFVRTLVLHNSYPGQVATTGNYALPLCPLQTPVGPVFKFNVYHLMDVHGDEATLFPAKIKSIGGKTSTKPWASDLNTNYKPVPQLPLQTVIKKQVVNEETTMYNLARIIRSKNSGPFEITFDILFDDINTFKRVQNSNVMSDELIMKLYNVKKEHIVTNMFFEVALAWKATIVRPWAQGSVGERDTFGTQYHAPLLDIVIPAAGGTTIKANGHVNGVNGVNGVH